MSIPDEISEEITNNLISTDEDKREEASLAILASIRKKVEDIGEPSNFDHNYSKISNALYCAACLLPIRNGDIAYCMECCDSVCHIPCLSKIAESNKSIMYHQCPNCNKEFSNDMIHKFVKMQQVIDYVQKLLQY